MDFKAFSAKVPLDSWQLLHHFVEKGSHQVTILHGLKPAHWCCTMQTYQYNSHIICQEKVKVNTPKLTTHATTDDYPASKPQVKLERHLAGYQWLLKGYRQNIAGVPFGHDCFL